MLEKQKQIQMADTADRPFLSSLSASFIDPLSGHSHDVSLGGCSRLWAGGTRRSHRAHPISSDCEHGGSRGVERVGGLSLTSAPPPGGRRWNRSGWDATPRTSPEWTVAGVCTRRTTPVGRNSAAALQLDCDRVQLPVPDAEPLGEATRLNRERIDTGTV